MTALVLEQFSLVGSKGLSGLNMFKKIIGSLEVSFLTAADRK